MINIMSPITTSNRTITRKSVDICCLDLRLSPPPGWVRVKPFLSFFSSGRIGGITPFPNPNSSASCENDQVQTVSDAQRQTAGRAGGKPAKRRSLHGAHVTRSRQRCVPNSSQPPHFRFEHLPHETSSHNAQACTATFHKMLSFPTFLRTERPLLRKLRTCKACLVVPLIYIAVRTHDIRKSLLRVDVSPALSICKSLLLQRDPQISHCCYFPPLNKLLFVTCALTRLPLDASHLFPTTSSTR